MAYPIPEYSRDLVARSHQHVRAIQTYATFQINDRTPHNQYIYNIIIVTLVTHILIPLVLMSYGIVGALTNAFDNMLMPLLTLGVLPGVAGVISVLLLKRALAGDTQYVAKLILGTSTMLVMVSVLMTGGLFASAVLGLLVLFVMAVLVFNFRVMMLYYAVIIGYFVGIFVIDHVWDLPTVFQFSELFHLIILIVSLTTLLLIVGYHKYAILESSDRMLALEAKETRYNVQRELTQNLAHDLKTPISVLKSTTYLIRKRQEKDMPIEEKLVALEATTHNLHMMIEDLLALTMLDSANKDENIAVVTILDLVQDTIQSLTDLATTNNISVHLVNDLTCDSIRGHASQLQRAITNLIENAIIYGKEGGHINVALSNDTHYVFIRVQDDGIGIAPEHHEQIFERFFQVNQARTMQQNKGTGIGLSMVRRIVQLHGGQITVDSQLEHGSTFTVRLPLDQAQ